ncbi:MAG: hypothetical protein R2839_02170 [Thermomicrobiales bacterium]
MAPSSGMVLSGSVMLSGSCPEHIESEAVGADASTVMLYGRPDAARLDNRGNRNNNVINR